MSAFTSKYPSSAHTGPECKIKYKILVYLSQVKLYLFSSNTQELNILVLAPPQPCTELEKSGRKKGQPKIFGTGGHFYYCSPKYVLDRSQPEAIQTDQARLGYLDGQQAKDAKRVSWPGQVTRTRRKSKAVRLGGICNHWAFSASYIWPEWVKKSRCDVCIKCQ